MSVGSGKLSRSLAVGCLALVGLVAQESTSPEPPRAARRVFERAERAERNRKVAEARRGYEAAVALYPDYSEAWCGLGLLQAEHDEFGSAMRSFRQAIRSDPKSICPYLPLAMLEHGAGDWPALVEVTDRMLRLDSIDYPLAHLLNAAGHYNLGEFDEAEKSARAAEALDSRNFPKMWELLGWTAVKRRDDPVAVAQFEKYLGAMPMDADADVVRRALAHLAARPPAISREEPSSTTFRVDTNLALVQFQVIPKRSHLVMSLRPEDIEIREDGVPQKAILYEAGRSYRTGMPVEISLLFDCSDSVQSIGVDPFVFNTSLLDEYENVSVAVYAFTGPGDPVDALAEDLKRFTKPTRDARTLKKAMDAVLTMRPSDTPLFSAIGDTVRDAGATTRGAIRMLVVFSDGLSVTPGVGGGPDLARQGYPIEAARRYGVSIYPVVIPQPLAGQYMAYDSPDSEGAFQALGNGTGGRSYVHTATDSVLPNILKSLANEVLPYTYVAGYYPKASDKGTRHEAQVVLLNKSKGQLNGGSRIVVH